MKFLLITFIIILNVFLSTDSMAEIKGRQKLAQLQPTFQKKIAELLSWANITFPNDTIVIACAYRSPEEQNKLYKKGKHVTKAKAYQSKHQFGLAVDMYFIDNGKIASYDKRYKMLGEKAEQLGIIWGGRWKTLKDYGHFESKEKIK